MSKVYLKAEDIDFDLNSLKDKIRPRRILMCTPDFFNVTEPINEFMVTKADGRTAINRIDPRLKMILY